MKKITLLILLIAFQLAVVAQMDVTSSVMSNPNFDETPYDSSWSLEIKADDPGVATLSDAGVLSAVGDHGAAIEITTQTQMNHMYLATTLNTTDLHGKDLDISFKSAKVWGTNSAGSFIIMITADDQTETLVNLVPGGHNAGKSQQWTVAGDAQGTYQDETMRITVPQGANELYLQLWVGSNLGTFYFDEFTITDVNATTASVDENALNAIKMYPNPTNGRLSFDNITDIQKIEVLDVHGKTVRTVINQNSIDIESLTPGVYIARIGLSNDQSVVKKVIKN